LEVSISPFRVWSYLRYLWLRRHRSATLFPYTTLFRSIWFCCILSPEQNIFSMTLFIQSIILMLAIALISQCQDRSGAGGHADTRSEEHTSELQSRENLVCRLLLEKKKTSNQSATMRIS